LIECPECGGPLESLAADCEICQGLSRVIAKIKERNAAYKERNAAYKERKIREWQAAND